YQEELRILYVALTRAREKLILVGTMKDQESVRRRYIGRSSYYDIIRRQLMTAHNVFQIGEARAFPPRHRVNPLDQFLQRRDSLDPVLAEAAEEQVRQRLDYRYPHEEALRTKAKYSVSELRARKEQEEAGIGEDAGIKAMAYRAAAITALRDPEAEAEAPISGAEIGTAYHRIMEALDFRRCLPEDQQDGSGSGNRTETGSGAASYIRGVAEDLLRKGALEEAVYKKIRLSCIEAFFASPVGIRACQAARCGKLRKERPFTLRTESCGHTVLVQGIIDCWFEEDGGLVLVDYKSNYVSGDAEGEESIVRKYREQMRLYREALEKGTGMQVRETYLYLFTLGKTVPV
ncbi:MAG: PD-(D/E)XK nuclease family protein, partial [Mogibacterium sp.]|nr:PD-(D/E)XK nuclease family protein [Mogibacterium sp.]